MQRAYKSACYKAGEYIDGDIYPVYRPGGKRKGKFNPTSEMQAKLNDKYSKERLTRLLHLNFTKADYELHLTYADGNLPEDEAQAKKDVQNFIRRAKRLYKKAGIELKYIWVTEKGKKSERIHHHITLSGGVDRTALENLWVLGMANTKALKFTKDGLKGLSHYITKQPLYFRRYNCSKNLKQPEAHQLKTSISHKLMDALFDEELARQFFEKQYPGYTLSSVEACINDVNGGYYVKFFMYRSDAKLLNPERREVRRN